MRTTSACLLWRIKRPLGRAPDWKTEPPTEETTAKPALDRGSEGITFDKYQELLEDGATEHANAFSITFSRPHTPPEERVRFMFRYYRNFNKFPRFVKVIPLELNYFDAKQSRYIRLVDLKWLELIRIRELYFNTEGEFVIRYYNRESRQEVEKKNANISEAVQCLYDDVLQNVFHLR
jgi:hypothetical protein